MNLLSVSGITKQKAGKLVLQDINFTQNRLEKIALAGETGSGKSTLLKIIAGLVQPDSGEVIFEGERVSGPEEKLLPGHKSIAYLSQHFELRNNYRVEEELVYTNKLTEEQAKKIYEVCRISHLLKRKTDELSGGEKQRIATARLLISSPRLLLLDEPFSNLDMAHKNMMKAVINDICETLKFTCVLVSHDPLDTLSWAEQILVIKDGTLIQKGTPQQVYRQPVNKCTAALFGKYNLLTPSQAVAFIKSSDAKINGKNLLIRPEQFFLVAEGNDAVKGTVNKVQFFGSYYEIKVRVSDFIVTVKTSVCNFIKGDEIYISLPGNEAWYVD